MTEMGLKKRAFLGAARMWREILGGEPNWDILGRALKNIVLDAEFLPRWRCYLEAHANPKEAKFASPWKFAQTYGQWEPPKAGVSTEERKKLQGTTSVHVCPRCRHTFIGPRIGPDDSDVLCLACSEAA